MILLLLLFTLLFSIKAQIVGVVASSGGTVTPATYGSELVTNGNFTSATGWTLYSGATVTGGECVINSAATYTEMVYETIVLSAGTTYHIEFDITGYTSGTLKVLLGSTSDGCYNDIMYTSNQHVSFDLLFDCATAPLRITFYSWNIGPVLHLDNVSVKEVL